MSCLLVVCCIMLKSSKMAQFTFLCNYFVTSMLYNGCGFVLLAGGSRSQLAFRYVGHIKLKLQNMFNLEVVI